MEGFHFTRELLAFGCSQQYFYLQLYSFLMGMQLVTLSKCVLVESKTIKP